MNLDLNSVLNVDQNDLFQGKLVLLSENRVDSSFLIHHWVAQYAKQEHNICLIGLVHSFNHYSSVTNKLGVNLNAAREKGSFVFIDGLKMCSNNLLNNQNPKSVHSDISVEQHVNIEDDVMSIYLKNLFSSSKDAVEKLQRNSFKQTVIIIDGLTSLLSLGAHLENIINMMHYLQLLVLSPGQSNGCMVVQMSNDEDVEDEDCNVLLKHLHHRCHLHVQASGLDSGYCKDVHGQVCFSIMFVVFTGKGLLIICNDK